MKISFVTTIYKTSDSLVPFIQQVREVSSELNADYEIVFVNDNSPDDGLIIATELAESDNRIIIVDLARNYGQHKALWTGLEVATGDYVMILDGDMEEEPRWVTTFFEKMNSSNADVVYGIQENPKGNLIYRYCRKLFYASLGALSDFDFPHNVTTARLMKRDYVEALKTFTEREIWLVGIMHVAGYNQLSVKISKLNSAPTKHSISMLVRLFIMAVTAFSIKPLIGVFAAGILISILAFLNIGAILLNYLINGVGVPGWASVASGMILIAGILTSFLGIIAIYVGTIFLEVKRRPRTIVKSIYQNKVS